jgi:hypothetical protein
MAKTARSVAIFRPLQLRADAAIQPAAHSRREDTIMLKSTFVVACAVATLGLVVAAPVARANVPHTMYLTFSAPFALPGIALPAGTYVFEVLVPGSSAVVRVTSRDGAKVYLTSFTRRIGRPAGLRADRPVVFNEVPAGMTPPVKAWFPVGDAMGHEFIYPEGSRQLGN